MNQVTRSGESSRWGAGAVHGASLSYTLAQGILEMIHMRDLHQGDAIPNARLLSEHFQVATPTIREALRTLEATGAVELRHGSGTYVGRNIGRLVLPNPNGLEITDDVRLQMLDARLVIEPSIAEMAASRDLPPEEFDNLRQTVGDRPSPDNNTGKTRTFHRELAKLAGNVVLFEVVDSLLSIRSPEQREIKRLLDDKYDQHQHSAIVDAVVAQQPALARELVRKHLVDVRAQVVVGLTTPAS